MAIKVTLRQKPISKGRKSLYLDFYPPIRVTGSDKKTRREFLGLYIYDKPKKPIHKLDNQQTILLAEQIRQKRDNEINKPEIYTIFELNLLKEKEKGELSFINYFEQLAEKRGGKSYDLWVASLYYLKDFTKGSLKFADLNEKFVGDFRNYLIKAKSRRSNKSYISQNPARSYLVKFKTVLNQAFKESLISSNLSATIEPIKSIETNKTFLTLEEVNRLAQTECVNPLLKRASLFSILTGLRFSDIQKLKWGEIEFIDTNGYFLRFQQKKTKTRENLPISNQAYTLLGKQKEPGKQVFEGLVYSPYQNYLLLRWAMSAGITKHLTFHCFRHTYATLQLKGGTDIYTVSKMLGHKDLKTTQIYAKIVDETKRKATEKIKIDI